MCIRDSEGGLPGIVEEGVLGGEARFYGGGGLGGSELGGGEQDEGGGGEQMGTHAERVAERLERQAEKFRRRSLGRARGSRIERLS